VIARYPLAALLAARSAEVDERRAELARAVEQRENARARVRAAHDTLAQHRGERDAMLAREHRRSNPTVGGSIRLERFRRAELAREQELADRCAAAEQEERAAERAESAAEDALARARAELEAAERHHAQFQEGLRRAEIDAEERAIDDHVAARVKRPRSPT
jgi:hypothetical protein